MSQQETRRDPHVEWLISVEPQDIYKWYSVRSKGDIVQSLSAMIEALLAERARTAACLADIQRLRELVKSAEKYVGMQIGEGPLSDAGEAFYLARDIRAALAAPAAGSPPAETE